MNKMEERSVPLRLLAVLSVPFLVGLVMVGLTYPTVGHADRVAVKDSVAVVDMNMCYLVGK